MRFAFRDMLVGIHEEFYLYSTPIMIYAVFAKLLQKRHEVFKTYKCYRLTKIDQNFLGLVSPGAGFPLIACMMVFWRCAMAAAAAGVWATTATGAGSALVISATRSGCLANAAKVLGDWGARPTGCCKTGDIIGWFASARGTE